MNKMDMSQFMALDPMARLSLLLTALNKAARPEVIFGDNASDAKAIKNRIAKLVHPDSIPGDADDAIATEAFQSLDKMWVWAEDLIAKGEYGVYDRTKTAATDKIKVAGKDYTATDVMWRDDIAEVRFAYDVNGKCYLLRVAIDPADNDLIKREKTILTGINANGLYAELDMDTVIPKPVGLFNVGGTHTAILLDYNDESLDTTKGDKRFFLEQVRPLRQIAEFYNRQMPIRSIGWMFNRLWAATTFLHDAGAIHAALTPDNILVQASNHHVIISNFGHASWEQEFVASMPNEWASIYPAEIYPKKETPQFGSDTYLIGMSLLWAYTNFEVSRASFLFSAGKDAIESETGLPPSMWNFIRDMIHPNIPSRPYRYSLETDNWRTVIHEKLGWKREWVDLPFDPTQTAVDWSWWWVS